MDIISSLLQLRSAQLQHAMRSLTVAMRTDSATAIFASLGLEIEDGREALERGNGTTQTYFHLLILPAVLEALVRAMMAKNERDGSATEEKGG
mgnify:CR=1 FL=1